MERLHISLGPRGPFADSQRLGLEYALALDAERLLAPCCVALGREPKAAAYGGWESRQIAGHTLGHYLSALAAFSRETGDGRARERLDYAVSRVAELQRADGYFGGIPSAPFDAVADGTDFAVERFSLAGFWVPWYSIHKIYAGLVDAFLVGESAAALGVVRKMADWAVGRFAGVGDGAFQRMLECEHGGMCRVFADLFGITGDGRYLAMAERFVHREIAEPAMRGEDRLPGVHANTQIPKFIGLARLYDLTGDARYRTAAEFFFDTVLEKQTYAIGGNSVGEHFQEPRAEALATDTCETCNTHNMLSLAESVFRWRRDAATAEYCELALYNHILGSQDPASGAKTYFVSMKSGTSRVYCSAEHAFWCCTGTGLENPARYNRYVCADIDGTLYLNLFVAATVATDDGWKVRIDTAFPSEPSVAVTVLAAGSRARALKVRVPSWLDAARRAEAGIGEADELGWWTASIALSAGDRVEFSLPTRLRPRFAKNGSGAFNITYGPIALAAALGTRGRIPSDIVDEQGALADWPAVPFTAFVGNPNALEDWALPVDRASLRFRTRPEAAENRESYELRPFYSIHHECYALYFEPPNATLTRPN